MDSKLPEGSLKYDDDKVNMALLPFNALYEVAKVLTFGAKKYAKHGWKSIPDGEERCTAALLRHLTEIQNGNMYDDESGLLHISHLATNALFLVYYQLSKINVKDYNG